MPARDEPPVSDDDLSEKEECTLVVDGTDEYKSEKQCSNGRICIDIGNKQNNETKRNTIVKGICVG